MHRRDWDGRVRRKGRSLRKDDYEEQDAVVDLGPSFVTSRTRCAAQTFSAFGGASGRSTVLSAPTCGRCDGVPQKASGHPTRAGVVTPGDNRRQKKALR